MSNIKASNLNSKLPNSTLRLKPPTLSEDPPRLTFSFVRFDRYHKLFNLGDKTNGDVVLGEWYLDWLDCMKSVAGVF